MAIIEFFLKPNLIPRIAGSVGTFSSLGDMTPEWVYQMKSPGGAHSPGDKRPDLHIFRKASKRFSSRWQNKGVISTTAVT